ncbi:hypothetical protein N7470_008685 [Penicillium chermesinum]|nr:hypothetical protein N7470_008685 [Penicillium chermesinum]
MPSLEGLSDARVIILATHLCIGGHVADLPILQAQYPHCFPLERLLRIILTFLPESTEPSEYVGVIQQLVENTGASTSEREIDISAVKNLSESEARRRLRKLRLRPLKRDDEEEEVVSAGPLTQFIIHRAHLIDSETSLQPLVLSLVLPFYENNLVIRRWLISSLLPALRLNYEYYPNHDETISLETLELMDDRTAVNVLLSIAGPERNDMDLVNNLRGLVGPWLQGSTRSKRRKLNERAIDSSISFVQGTPKPDSVECTGWDYVNEWLLSRSTIDSESVVHAFMNWAGPEDTDLGGYQDGNTEIPPEKAKGLLQRYSQSGLSTIYAKADASKATLEDSAKILQSIMKLQNLEEFSYLDSPEGVLPSVDFDTGFISSTSRASLLQNALLAPENPLTSPSPSSISFLSAIILSLRILNALGHETNCRIVANMCLHSNEEMQAAELKGVIASTARQTRSRQDWQVIRQQLLWLRDWQAEQSEDGWSEPSTHHGLFWKISRDDVEIEILKALLGAREYRLAVEVYTQSSAPLDTMQVETAVVDSIFTAYDNASNGNRTRGGMKKAFEILQAFQPHFPDSATLKQIGSLIAATHALSFYSLTLQHGVPFQPVSIRVHHDPLSLVEKVLEQNPKSYTKLDDLLSIGRNLVEAGLCTMPPPTPADAHIPPEKLSQADALVTAERRITSLSISSALDSNDFDTAYSYILTRLTSPSHLTNTSSPSTSIPDDISWRAVYNAGRYRSTSPTASTPLQTQINHLSQRMELLSLALVLVPIPDPLPEILGAWRRCDEELSSLRARELHEEDVWDTKGDSLSTVPGGFGPTDFERDAFDTAQQRAARRARARAMPHSHPHEAPMGLFEVARGAALALRKMLSRCGGLRVMSLPVREGDRVRKRDMVSNMVTGGLASGIGWVLGAEPVNRS